ncbi:PD-(D/E)XK motif protein [Prochlorococcus marinus XMU1419]|uniref:PD-(D/E)XK motif protein n=1 Tax=Prochlorococcus marinus TaxID=1219 RepID=UPI001ADB43C4|nr:PD-(D/E)XK motif protein [Prochlorococcus marinus]MBO8233287.1 PD-(D/E)XK motif protein [Prochlorococcus marinus XMU1419]MBW3076767.1 hypothetical protein [Prochlorococcus marinus str. XMU1419]|tara:strand:- start:666 stop:1646 length:981 start_codon:yes stop_codon:yes gene_type:complete
MINFWQGLWDQKVPKGDLKYASISLALNSPWMIKATKDDKGRIGFQLIAEKTKMNDQIYKRKLLKTSQVSVTFVDKKTLYIRLEDIDAKEEFNEYAESIIIKAAQASSEIEMIEIAISKSLKWFNFLKPINERKLKPFQQQGLIAELLFLKKIVNKIGLSDALNSWCGQESFDKDFILGKLGVEIKAKQSGKIKVTISSSSQLDLQGLEKLILNVYSINSASSLDKNAFNLDQLVSEIYELFSSEINLKYLFQDKLDEANYDFDHDYSDRFWIDLEENQFYNVTEKFPSITSENINVKSISNVSYDINLNTIKEFKITAEEFEKLI